MKVFRSIPTIGLSAVLLTASASVTALAATVPSHIAPALERDGQRLGQESPSTQLNLTVWLNMHNKAELDSRVKEMYTPGSSSFRQFMSVDDLKKYAPTPAETEAVKAELTAHGLKVLGTDDLGFTVRVTGSTSDFESAFHTQISKMSLKGEVVRVTSSTPELGGKAAGLVSHLGGLNSLKTRPQLVRPTNPHTGKPFAGKKVSLKGTPEGAYYTANCFQSPLTLSLSGISADDFVTPETASYTGLGYGGDPTVTTKGDLAPCGYGPSDVAKIYDLDGLYSKGIKGKGQTIVIIDSGLQPTAQSNIDLFSKIEGIPSVKLKLVGTPFGTNQVGIDLGTDEETDLDVQWAHAVAPAAGITLVESFDEEDINQQNAILYTVEKHLGNVVSFSYGYTESYESPLSLNIWEYVTELAAASGIAFDASSGDDGDDSAFGIPPTSNAPADSPYVTSVGGTSVAFINKTPVTTGWGTNIDFLSFSDGSTTYIEDPSLGFYNFGGGGGVSAFFPKPSYQVKLPGSGRLVPDVSALADPYTGGEFVYDDGAGDQYIGVVGGTSLASPIFTGIWALADEAAGTSLGQAAPYIALAPSSWIVDVLPVNGPANVTGSVTNSTTGVTTKYSASTLGQPLDSTVDFASTIWNLGQGEYAIVTFGTDYDLTITQGWDDVTGYGTPNAYNLVEGIGKLAKQ